jgi:hypothetical protein
MVHKNDSSRRKMVPCRHCQPSLAHSRNSDNGGSADKQRQSGQRCLGIVGHSLASSVAAMKAAMQTMGATTKVVAVGRKVPWYFWAFLAVTRDHNNCSGVPNDAQQSNAATVVPWHVACPSPCCVMMTASVAQRTVRDDGGGGSGNNGALASLATPCLLLQWP